MITPTIIDNRHQLLTDWVAQVMPEFAGPLSVVSGDASFRRYFRTPTNRNGVTLIAVDAPPKQEQLTPFIQVAEKLTATGVSVPTIYQVDEDAGFMLLSDLGDRLMLQLVQSQPDSADTLYRHAIDAMVQFQAKGQTTGLPDYDHALLMREMNLFSDWLLERQLGLMITKQQQEMLQQWYQQLATAALAQQRTLVHRDYHSRNLLVQDDQSMGIIDFQDAVIGPITYDLVSLLKDCYVSWPRERQLYWVNYFHEQAASNDIELPEFDALVRQFDWMGVQRHLKAAGIFARLNQRDHKPGYLPDIPRTMQYIVDMFELYPEFSHLKQWFSDELHSAFEQHGLGWQEVD